MLAFYLRCVIMYVLEKMLFLRFFDYKGPEKL